MLIAYIVMSVPCTCTSATMQYLPSIQLRSCVHHSFYVLLLDFVVRIRALRQFSCIWHQTSETNQCFFFHFHFHTIAEKKPKKNHR